MNSGKWSGRTAREAYARQVEAHAAGITVEELDARDDAANTEQKAAPAESAQPAPEAKPKSTTKAKAKASPKKKAAR